MPKQNSSGGKENLGSISKAGNRYLRRRNGGHPLRRTERDQAAMAGAVDGAANSQGCSGRAGQQDRPDGPGIERAVRVPSETHSPHWLRSHRRRPSFKTLSTVRTRI
ncbi:transposase [Mesorhizobium abyssinicae]|uniref:transposase n=1 Tax=Mesorhizobium abyssinicae TaxID=1209958 RepID=UPI00387DD0CB